MRGRVVIFLFLVLALLVICSDVVARESSAGAAAPAASPATPVSLAPAVPAPTPPTLIPLEEISAQSVSTIERLRGILTELRREVSIRQLEKEIPPILKSVSDLKDADAMLQASQLTGRAVSSLQREWLLDQARLAGVEEDLARRVQTLLRYREETRQTSDLWERSRTAARAGSAPGPIIEQADGVLQMARQVGAALDQQLVPTLTLRKRVNEAQLTVAEGMEWVESASEEVNKDLLRLDSPPLWKALGAEAREAPAVPGSRLTRETLKRTLGTFFQTYRGRVEIHVAAAAGLLILLLRLRRRAREAPAVAAGPEAEAVMTRPVATTLLMGLIAALVVYPRAPIALLELAAVASILPTLVLLPRLVTHRGRRALFCLLTIFLALRMVMAVMENPLAIRVALLGISLSGILLLSWWLRPASPFRALPPAPRRDVPPIAAKAALGILVAAFALNLIGNVSLAWLLTAATVNSAYLAMMLYLTFLLNEGLVPMLVSSRTVPMLNVVRLQGDLIRHHLTRWSSLASLFLWAYLTASFFGLSGLVLDYLTSLMTTRWKLGVVTISPGSVLVFGVTLWLSVLLSRLVSFLFAGDVFPRLGLGRGVPEIISMMIRYGLITAGFLLAIAAAGVDLGQFAIVAGALGVGIGFGLQSIVSNFISGLILMFERPIRVSDTIQVGTLLGQVRHIGVRGSILRTPEGADVVVPNANLISGEIVNWTLSDHLRRMEILVGVSYGSDPTRVLALLEQTACAHPEVVRVPPPQSLFLRFGESSLDFSLRFWTDRFDDWVRIQSEVSVRVHGALREAGISIPFPQRDLHLYPADKTPGPGTPTA